jgi:hypothetical protein
MTLRKRIKDKQWRNELKTVILRAGKIEFANKIYNRQDDVIKALFWLLNLLKQHYMKNVIKNQQTKAIIFNTEK